jgi:hypothetical protein
VGVHKDTRSAVLGSYWLPWVSILPLPCFVGHQTFAKVEDESSVIMPPHTAVVERQAIASGSEAEIPGSGDGNDPGPGTLMSLLTRISLALLLNASIADADRAPSTLLNRLSYLDFCNSEERCWSMNASTVN